jgi:hypothetical protein
LALPRAANHIGNQWGRRWKCWKQRLCRKIKRMEISEEFLAYGRPQEPLTLIELESATIREIRV